MLHPAPCPPSTMLLPRTHLLAPLPFPLHRPNCKQPTVSLSLRRTSSLAAVSSPTAAAETAVKLPLTRVDVLTEALPFIQKFQNKTIVVKYGGAAMKSPELQSSVLRDLVLLSLVGLRPILVHGGGPEINSWLGRLGIEPKFLNGLRVTDEVTMEVVEMVLCGKVNKNLVSLLTLAGASAVGLSGKDDQLIIARKAPGPVELGFVGEVVTVQPKVLFPLIESKVIPVIATVAADEKGQSYNINADTAAGAIAAAVGAEKLILLTDVAGILLDRNDPESLVKETNIAEIRKMVADKVVAGGMIPKVECCVRSIAQGVKTASIIDGRVPHSLLLEILTDDGTGTMITG